MLMGDAVQLRFLRPEVLLVAICGLPLQWQWVACDVTALLCTIVQSALLSAGWPEYAERGVLEAVAEVSEVFEKAHH
jgi:hypothetical protein